MVMEKNFGQVHRGNGVLLLGVADEIDIYNGEDAFELGSGIIGIARIYNRGRILPCVKVHGLDRGWRISGKTEKSYRKSLIGCDTQFD